MARNVYLLDYIVGARGRTRVPMSQHEDDVRMAERMAEEVKDTTADLRRKFSNLADRDRVDRLWRQDQEPPRADVQPPRSSPN